MDFTNLGQKAKRLIDQYCMIENGDVVLAAFSGGSDSSALLYYLTENFGGKNNICAAHLNHMIRGAEADGDEEFAVKICEKYGVAIFTERKNIPEIAKKTKKSIEEAARNERYAFFTRTAEKIGRRVKVATAHTASDNTESVLFNLSRGCGLEGLRGIMPVYKNIIRPLLLCSREDVLEYCEKYNIPYTEDKTNSDEIYTRNFIRRNITSKLKEKFNNLDENIFKTAEIARGAADFLNFCAESLIREYSGALTPKTILSQHKSLRYAVIAKLYEKAVFPAEKKLEYRHVLSVEKLLENHGNLRKSIDLPGFITAEVSPEKLIFEKAEEKKTSGGHRLLQK